MRFCALLLKLCNFGLAMIIQVNWIWYSLFWGICCLCFTSCRKPMSAFPSGSFVELKPEAVAINKPIRVLNNEPKMLALKYNFQDGDGDITEISLTKIIINRRPAPRNVRFVLPLNVSWPEIPKQNNQQGSVEFLFNYIELGGATRVNVDDTVVFALQLKDAQGHMSDSIYSAKVVILRSSSARNN